MMFFFSSRRRHTRSKRDWSSDVCSSDLGDGGSTHEWRAGTAGLTNVAFPGWVSRPQIEVLAGRSLAALIPYRNRDDFQRSIPNKVLDALALGMPLLSPLDGEVAKLIGTHEVGLRYGADAG